MHTENEMKPVIPTFDHNTTDSLQTPCPVCKAMMNNAGYNKTQVVKLVTVNVSNCHACSNEHEYLPVRELEIRMDWYTHVANCPETDKPIYIKFTSQ